MKKLLILSMLILLTGCSADYTLEIKDNLTVLEYSSIMEKNAIIQGTYENLNDGLDAKLNQWYYANGFWRYEKEKVYTDKTAGIATFRKYNDIKSLEDSLLFGGGFSEVQVIEEGMNLKVKFLVSDDGVFSIYQPDDSFSFSKANIRIESFYDVVSGNYDSYDEDTHTMKWEFTSSKNKDIEFTIDIESYEELIDSEITENSNDFLWVYIFIGFVGIIGLVVFYVYKKYDEVNKF